MALLSIDSAKMTVTWMVLMFLASGEVLLTVSAPVCSKECYCWEFQSNWTGATCWSYSEEVVFQLPNNTVDLKLSHIYLQDLTYLAPVISSLPNLWLLWIAYSDVTHLTSDLFHGLNNLELLELSFLEHLGKTDENIVTQLPSLKELRMEKCTMDDLSLLRHLNTTSIRTLVLDRITISGPPETQILSLSFMKLVESLPDLKNLILTSDNITNIPPDFHKYVQNIRCLVLNGNPLSGDVLKELGIPKLNELRLLDIGFSIAGEYDDISLIDIAKRCDEPFVDSIEIANISDELLNDTEHLLATQCSGIIGQLPPNLNYILMNGINFHTIPGFADISGVTENSSPLLCVYPNNSVIYLSVSDNTLTFPRVSSVLGYLMLRYLAIERCGLTSLPFDRFAHFPSLHTLLLSGNALGKWFHQGNATFSLTFLTNLRRLDLSNADINFISDEDWSFLLSIKYLNLSFNRLSSISLSHHYNLSFSLLNISHNYFRNLSDSFMLSFDELLSREPNASIDLTGNPLSCDCGSIDFLTWMKNRSNHFFQYESYECIDEVTIANCSAEPNQHDDGNDDDTPWTLIIVVIVVSVCLVCLVGAAVYWRRRLYYMCFLVKFNLQKRKLRGHGFNHFENEYTYDAFVVYCSEDRDWVLNELYAKLRPVYNLCIGDIAFGPNQPILSLVTDALKNSHCVIIVASNALLTSRWCEIEATMALLHHRDIILINLEDLNFRLMPPCIYYLYKRKARLLFPADNEELQEKFWGQLENELHHVTHKLYLHDPAFDMEDHL